jgi:hypothetical protein
MSSIFRKHQLLGLARNAPGDTPRSFLNIEQRCRSLAKPQPSAIAFSGNVEFSSKFSARASLVEVRNSFIPV